MPCLDDHHQPRGGAPLVTYLLLHQTEVSSLYTNDGVISADSIPLLHSACDVLAAVSTLQTSLAEKCATKHAEAFAQGLAEGRAEGREHSQDELARHMAELTATLQKDRAQTAQSVAQIALEVVRQICQSLGDTATVTALAERAARALTPQAKLTVYVNSQVLPAVQARLKVVDPSIEVLPADHLALTGCVLESPIGRVDASLETQLQVLEAAFAKAALEAPATPDGFSFSGADDHDDEADDFDFRFADDGASSDALHMQEDGYDEDNLPNDNEVDDVAA